MVRAAQQDYEGFYQEEILYREIMGYPPVSHMVAVQIFAKEERRGGCLAESLAGAVREHFPETMDGRSQLRLIGPAPAAIGKINDIFRFVFYVKCPQYEKLVCVKDFLEEEVKKSQIREEMVQFDFDPVHMM